MRNLVQDQKDPESLSDSPPTKKFKPSKKERMNDMKMKMRKIIAKFE